MVNCIPICKKKELPEFRVIENNTENFTITLVNNYFI